MAYTVVFADGSQANPIMADRVITGNDWTELRAGEVTVAYLQTSQIRLILKVDDGAETTDVMKKPRGARMVSPPE